MADLRSEYMGIPLKNPLVVGACSLTAHVDAIKKMEDKGAGAFVIQSLFEEQIQLQKYKMEEQLAANDNLDAEIQNIFPKLEHAGPDEHLMWVRKSKEAVEIPVIASLNALSHDTWVEWAKKLEQTGVDGLELNFFAIPIDAKRSATDIESEQVETIKAVSAAVKIPVSVKLSAFYTSPLEIIKRLDDAGAKGLVLFNRMFHPSFDIEREKGSFPFNLSNPNDHRMALRFVGLLHENVTASLCASNGIHSGSDAVEVLLAGADVFQCVSTVYLNTIDVIQKILADLDAWMTRKGYEKLADFRGKLSVNKTPDRWTYRRAQYVKMLLRSDDYIERPSLAE